MAEAEWSMKWILGLSLTLFLVVQMALGKIFIPLGLPVPAQPLLDSGA